MKDTLKTTVGHLAEQAACAFLREKGLQLVQANYRCPLGEIDLIMREKDEIIFVEVRLRNHTQYGDALDSVDIYKQRKIIKTATYFLNQKRWLDKVICRFDVIGISYAQPKANIEWIQDAFSIDYYS